MNLFKLILKLSLFLPVTGWATDPCSTLLANIERYPILNCGDANDPRKIMIDFAQDQAIVTSLGIETTLKRLLPDRDNMIEFDGGQTNILLTFSTRKTARGVAVANLGENSQNTTIWCQ